MTTSIFSNSWIGIVFDGRNQQYGAYELRKIFERNMLIAFLVSVSLLVGAGALLLLNYGNAKDASADFIAEKERPILVNPLPVPPIKAKPAPAAPAPETESNEEAPPVVVDADSLLAEDTTSAPKPQEPPDGPSGPVPPDGQVSVGNPGDGGTGVEPPVDNRVYIPGGLEVMPQYPGGENAMMKFLTGNIKYPEICKENGIEGKVYVHFVIDKEGYVTDVKVAKGAFKCLNDEAMRVVKMMPQWKPGMQNGQLVKVRYTVPIVFELN